jgi:hypothetical protein
MDNVYDLLPAILASARGRALHLGGENAVLSQIDAFLAANRTKPKNGLDKAREQFASVCTYLRQFHFDKPPQKALTNPAQF